MKLNLVLIFLTLLTLPKWVNGQTNTDTSTTYIYNKPASFKSQFIQSAFGTFGIKKLVEQYMTSKSFSQKPASLPKSVEKIYDVTVTEKNGRKIWTLKPKNKPSDKVVLYVHGGAYILNISKYQWKFVEDILAKTNATIIIPDYPLAPKANSKNTYIFIREIYQKLLQSGVLPQNISIMGDSAGGGFALGFAQELNIENEPQPAQIILLSPWLDITMSNPELNEVDKKDKMLGIKGLQLAGRAYAGTLDNKDFRVSPIYGNFQRLGKISVFIGTHDLFITDCRKLKELLDMENIPFNYFEYPKMFHGWMVVTGMKESKQAIRQITDLIKK